MPPRSSFPHHQILQDRLHSTTLHHGKFEIFLGPGFGGRIPAHSSPQMPVKCPFCPKEVTWSGRNKHIFGHAHLEEYVKPALLKEDQYALIGWRKEYSIESRSRSCPTLYLGSDKGIMLCFGCKKAKRFIDRDHLRECPHHVAHFTTLKALVGEAGATDVVVDPSEEVGKLKKKLAALQKDYKMVEDACEGLYEKEEEMDKFFKSIFGRSFDTLSDGEKEDIIAAAEEGKIMKLDD